MKYTQQGRDIRYRTNLPFSKACLIPINTVIDHLYLGYGISVPEIHLARLTCELSNHITSLAILLIGYHALSRSQLYYSIFCNLIHYQVVQEHEDNAGS